ncbi:NAD(P)H-dependent flavin oxidoreductase [Aerococcus mictus]|uniref:Probable nitronate monooxygenase n=1 Tax=Aerococcus mictus TaxID=2976810 RepID=A0A9Q4H6I7_9LACT|nr:nitronate monooxygenase [Aerococcus mictus]MCY3065170.1 nitronate monooxygenase [Aerococcus mictus]MCY3068841.1 nitronate monooxygenase [Aerococcus mictus]MCY3078428.1 nitronate monooxygenase [Aerococcus mictus]MCY3086999.1 nitronate monooxygenase [Aerococcus mictus]MCY3089031.1 nitronate monooxygenase [Aerococcus mictus]
MSNPLLEVIGTKYPILQGAMGGVAYHQLVAAVSEAGGLGIIASAGMDKETLHEEIRKTRELTDKPFGVNLMLMSPNIADMIEVIAEEKVPVITTGAGNPKPVIEPLHQAGCKVIPVVATARQAAKMEAAGVDAVVCEGNEAGGHIGTVATMTLTRAVSKAVKIPVVTAGGVADGHGLAAAFALGASGAQLGTVLVASEEAPIADSYKEATVSAQENSTFEMAREIGSPIRLLQTKGSDHLQEIIDNGGGREDFEPVSLELLVKGAKGDTENGTVTIGQIAGVVEEVRPVKEILDSMVEEADQVISSLSIL